MSSMYCTKKHKCKNAGWCASDYNPERDEYECFQRMTHGEQFRVQNDYELAEALFLIADGIGPLPKDATPEDWMQWLAQEVEG